MEGAAGGGWYKIKEHTLNKVSGMSAVCSKYATCLTIRSQWAPHELDAILACAYSDGTISVLTFKSMHYLFGHIIVF